MRSVRRWRLPKVPEAAEPGARAAQVRAVRAPEVAGLPVGVVQVPLVLRVAPVPAMVPPEEGHLPERAALVPAVALPTQARQTRK
ncbi:hypothetical protein J6524_32625 [Bradyrhizobium sp. WSM 1738]|uniref:hypothetical protein n=1 Tax=Bradyrhizobium hereditatis TaxID=2821405 RepID=UPI001CE2F64A|nr:hypothetical protein [Bradyrhizobium hereditatis]MCA6119584.1 hypothetical protein [Bradyrhizobium hereditatis]